MLGLQKIQSLFSRVMSLLHPNSCRPYDSRANGAFSAQIETPSGLGPEMVSSWREFAFATLASRRNP